MKNYIIVDFSAGNLKTHHLNYVLTYAHFIKNEDNSVTIVLPEHVKLEEEVEIVYDVRKILLSQKYRLDVCRLSLLGAYFFIRRNFKNFVLVRYLELIIDKYQLQVSSKRLIEIIRQKPNCVILFPSTDYLALKLVKSLNTDKVNYHSILLRFNSFEKLDPFNEKSDGLTLLEDLFKNNNRVKIGCETKSLQKFLESKSKIFRNLNWTPLPHVDRASIVKESGKNVFGFLGGAKQRKGFSEIPSWVTKISENLPGSKFLVQMAPYPWSGYEETLEYLKTNKNVVLVPEVTSNKEFFELISSCTFIVLPYDSNSYNLTHSSIFFYACDLLVPSITYMNMGFTYDILEFSCGIALDMSIRNLDLKNVLNFDRESLQIGIYNYNRARNDLNLSFLLIDNS